MFQANQRASLPTLAVCLLRDCRKSQRNIHSVRLGKPISYFRLDWSELERLSRSLFFFFAALPLCWTSASSRVPRSPSSPFFHPLPLCYFSSPNSSLSLLFIYSLRPHALFSLCSSPPFSSSFWRNKAQWERNGAPETSQGQRYLSSASLDKMEGITNITFSLAANIISEGGLSEGCVHVCLDGHSVAALKAGCQRFQFRPFLSAAQ